jgi:hypothetical protein
MRYFMLIVIVCSCRTSSIKFVKSTKDFSPQECAGLRFLNIKTKTM